MTHSTGLKGPAPRVAPNVTPASRVQNAMAGIHAKAAAKKDVGDPSPKPPAIHGGTAAGSFGHAVIPARYGKAPAPKAPAASSTKPSGAKRHP